MKPGAKPAQGSKDVLDLWLRHDLTKQFGRIEPAPADLIALIEDLCPNEPVHSTRGGDSNSRV